MSNVVSIFGECVNPDAKNYEKLINTEVKKSLYHFSNLMENLIHEHFAYKNNKRHISSKTVISHGVVIHLSYIDLIEAMFEEYVTDFGRTKYIKSKSAYFYSRIMPFFEKNLKKYNYLIDIKQCLEQYSNV